MDCFRAEADGIVLAVRLTPKGGHDSVDGTGVLSDGREVVLARVRAAPEDGAANAALVALLAKRFGRPKSAVTIVTGATGRLKQVCISGDVNALAAIVNAWPKK